MPTREIARYACLLGTMVQEAYATHSDLRAICDRVVSGHVAALDRDIEVAKQSFAPDARWSADSVGYSMRSALPGAFIFTEAEQAPGIALESLDHLRRYLEILPGQPDMETKS